MCSEIDSVTLALEQGRTALVEYENAIRQIEWDVFDLTRDRISAINDEADFLIDLMSNYDLYEDNGQFTSLGKATTGLRAVNYNTYMEEAEAYYKEMQSLQKEISNDPYNQDLIDRYNDLLELQQESILAAEDEKQAIKDLVEDGIEKELDSLKELIDTYEDALDAQKDYKLVRCNMKISQCIPSNCWEPLKPIKPQRKDETYLCVTAAKAEKIDWIAYGQILSAA